MNMLSAEKVRLHGMRDSKWTTQDKIVQYKGVVNLYKRDEKMTKSDKITAVKTTMAHINNLIREIRDKRAEFDGKICGARNLIENILVHHKAMRFAYRHLPADKIIEALKQNIYHQRRKLDVVLFRRHNKEKRLAELWLEKGDVEDTITYEVKGKIPIEIECGKVTAKVQDTILLTEAAISVKNSYNSIIQLLVKDSIYYDQLLFCLRKDLLQQNKCMIQVTVLGQVAVEYLDDRRSDYVTLEKHAKAAFKIRKADLFLSIEQLKQFPKNMSNLIRKDDDFYDYNVVDVNTDLEISNLEHSISFVETCLRDIKDAVLVSKYHFILPCLQEQVRINDKLKALQEQSESDKNKLTKSVNHAKVMLDNLTHTTFESYQTFKGKKDKLVENLNENNKLKDELERQNRYTSDILLKVRVALQNIEGVCKLIKPIDEKDLPDKTASVIFTDSEYISIQPDGKSSIKRIGPRLDYLIAGRALHDVTVTPDEFESYSKLKKLMTANIIKAEALVEVSYEELNTEDSSVPSRNEIKDRSTRIVEAHKAAELM